MSEEQRFDIVYKGTGECTVEPHFCRDYDCFGTNPDHGYTLEEACNIVTEYYEELYKSWLNRTHEDIKYYTNE